MTKPINAERILAAHAALAELQTTKATIAPRDAERLLFTAIGPLLENSGYALEDASQAQDSGADFFARRPTTGGDAAETIAIELKHTKRAMSLEAVHQLVGAALLAQVDRAVLVCSAGFTDSAHAALNRRSPVQVELVGYDELTHWAEAIANKASVHNALSVAIKKFSRFLALEIARNPLALAELEWFDIERTVAEVFDGLGFKVTLTPPAKDGGKDVVLEFNLAGHAVEYYVEVKHWRSATKVGSGSVSDFVGVIAREKVAGGVFLSTHGYTSTAFEHLTQLDRERVSFGGREKVLTLCQTYSKAQAGLWSPPSSLREILTENLV